VGAFPKEKHLFGDAFLLHQVMLPNDSPAAQGLPDKY